MTFKTLLVGTTALLLTACGQEAPVVAPEDAAVTAPAPVVISATEAVTGETRASYVLSWETTPAKAPVRIEVSTDPDFAIGEGEVLAVADKDGEFVWAAEADDTRRYFAIIPEAGEPVRTAVRLLPLEGGRNFRDLGGYETEDGRTVKWGQVYRSGVMDGLTEADYGYLTNLGIRTICDYRTSQEREAEPTNWQAGAIDYVTFPDPEGEEDMASNPMIAKLLDPEATAEDVAAGMAEGYVSIAYDQAPAYAAMFDRLAGGEIPLAFNCSAGKDRAGTSAALLLTALGVPREAVVADYSLSDDYVDYMEEFMGDKARIEAESQADHPYAFLFTLPPEKVAPLMDSRPEYIEATFAALEAEHGSVMAFIQTELDVTDQELTAIRAALLE